MFCVRACSYLLARVIQHLVMKFVLRLAVVGHSETLLDCANMNGRRVSWCLITWFVVTS